MRFFISTRQNPGLLSGNEAAKIKPLGIFIIMVILINVFIAALTIPIVPVYAQGEVNDIIFPPAVNDQITIYTAKKIITMENNNPQATAVAVKNKKIVAVGTLPEVKSALGKSKYVINNVFQSKIILPGLIDQHLHPFLGALTLSTAVIANEDWVLSTRTYKAALNPQEYLKKLKAAEAELKDKNEWLFSWGYHPLWHGKIDRKYLDGISKNRPIAVWHRSCHEFYFNSAAIKAMGLTKESMKNKGDASTMYNWDEGHWWETGLNLIVAPLTPFFVTRDRMVSGLKQMVTYLHQNGVTAYMEPGALVNQDLFKLYQQILGDESTPFYSFFVVDGRSQVDSGMGLSESLAATQKEIAWAPAGKVSFFPNQIKLFADGAIISQMMQMIDGYTDGHKGAWLMTPKNLEERSKLYWDAGYQIHIHVNGDLGLEVVLDTLERRMAENPRSGHRSVIVHFANSNEDEISRIAKLGAIVSANPYYVVGFADKFAEFGLGPKRADYMVRANSVLKRHIPLSFHSDLPMGPSAPLNFIWCAVNRVTPSGRVAGPEERINVKDGLRAITIESAYSWQKENDLGSIAPGKVANFTILDQDPLSVNPMKINEIPIWGTVFEGRIMPVKNYLSKKQAWHAEFTRPILGDMDNDASDWHMGCPCSVANLFAKVYVYKEKQ